MKVSSKTKKNDAQRRLALAFIQLAHEKGAHQVTLESVAKQAKMPFSTAHYQLKASGLTLVELAMIEVGTSGQRFIEAWLERRSIEASGSNSLHCYIDGTLEWAKKNRSYANFWLFQYHFIAVRTETRKRHQAFLDAAIRRIEQLVFENVGRGHYPAVKNSPELAMAIHSQLIGATVRALVSVQSDAIETHRLSILSAVDALIRASQNLLAQA